MKTYTNNFTYGRDLLKQIIIGAVVLAGAAAWFFTKSRKVKA